MQLLEVSGAVRPIYGSLGVKWLRKGKGKVHLTTDNEQAHRGSRGIALLFL
jgi:hypothetical protein